jgi:hypothetical protein
MLERYVRGGTVILMAIIFEGLSIQAGAQTSHFSSSDVRVIDARAFVNAPNDSQSYVQYVRGQDLVLTMKDTPESKDFAADGFQIRAFRLDTDGKPYSWAYFAPCYVYLSALYSFGKPTELRIDIGPLESRNWLHAEHGQPIRSERFELMFEGKTDADSLFRLNESDITAYFSRGLRIEVNPDRDYSAAEAAQQANLAAEDAINVRNAAQSNTPTSTCYRSNAAQSSTSSNLRISTLERCERTE